MNKLLNYLPPYLQRYRELQHITDAEYPEIELVNDGVKLVLSEQFILSLDDYGCNRWEKMLNIPSPDDATLEERRATILMYINSDLPYTLRKLQMILDARYGENMIIASTNKEYELWLEIDNQVILKSNEVRNLLRKIIPANLFLKLQQTMLSTCHAYAGGKVSCYKKIKIGTNTDFALPDFNIHAYAGGKISVIRKLRLETEEV